MRSSGTWTPASCDDRGHSESSGLGDPRDLGWSSSTARWSIVSMPARVWLKAALALIVGASQRVLAFAGMGDSAARG